MRKAWSIGYRRFSLVAAIVGEVQSYVITMLFYYTIFVPFALISRFFSDPLRLEDTQPKWVKREPVGTDLDSARGQG